MAFGGKDPRSIDLIQWMLWCKQEKHVLCGFSKEETLHPIDHLTGLDISQTCPPAFRPATSLEVAKNHLANMQIPRVLSGAVDIVRRLDEFRSASIPRKATIDITSSDIPPFRKSREACPNCSGQKMDLYSFIHLAVEREQTGIVRTQTVNPECARSTGYHVTDNEMGMLISLTSVQMAVDRRV